MAVFVAIVQQSGNVFIQMYDSFRFRLTVISEICNRQNRKIYDIFQNTDGIFRITTNNIFQNTNWFFRIPIEIFLNTIWFFRIPIHIFPNTNNIFFRIPLFSEYQGQDFSDYRQLFFRIPIIFFCLPIKIFLNTKNIFLITKTNIFQNTNRHFSDYQFDIFLNTKNIEFFRIPKI